ncbi:hypothetical protein Mterra_01115 [Calidithermus terrae]|uniref:Restriction system protein Mrr-like N-terminal domain-containing protein n=1 Tax=Calidithermus terrae TaxID=1408545 RepID=A0A399EVN0_9DEIN|nr:winged helix-turn-helix domain-containing protein [Calidithermus terrae]RIH87723.1 hypothetical protein Mterra_01115 [Calidithermus terrae]
MAEPYSLGPYKGELLLDLDGLFQVLRLVPPYPPRAALEQVLIKRAVAILVQWDTQVGLVSPDGVLWVEAEGAWLEGLVRQLEQLDPLSAEERSEQVLLEKLAENAGRKLWGFLEDVEALVAHGEMALRRAQESRRYEQVATLAYWLERLVKVQQGGEELAKLWGIFSGRKPDKPGKAVKRAPGKTEKPDKTGKRPKGTATPQQNYRLPILRALAELGGQGKAAEVLDRVYQQVKHLLKGEDMEPAYDDPGRDEPVWRNRARWEVASLKKEGLVQSGGYGSWVLTDRGRKYLEEHDGSA